jgi:hypothetical protein
VEDFGGYINRVMDGLRDNRVWISDNYDLKKSRIDLTLSKEDLVGRYFLFFKNYF